MRIGVDLGGTKIEAIVMSDDGEILIRRRIPCPPHSYEAIVGAIAELVVALETEFGEHCRVGVGTPGAPSLASGLMKNCSSTQLNDKPLLRDLERRLDRDIRMANDANCFALSEAIDGAGAQGSTVFGVILGTGVGGGLVVNRQLLTGRNAIAGEWGHIPMPGASEQRPCYCGKFDCVETYLCGGALLQSAQRSMPELSDNRELARWAAAGNADATFVMSAYCKQLASALAVLVNIVDPDVIVLGGGVSNIDALYTMLPALMPAAVFGNDYRTDIVAARYGDSSGVRGAAWLWPSRSL